METISEQDRIRAAEENADVLIAMLEHNHLKYQIAEQSPQRTYIKIHFTGNDLPMTLHIMLRTDKQIVSVISPMPFKMKEEVIPDAALAVAAANHGLIDGSFDLNLYTGEIRFRLASCFRGSLLSEDLFSYLMYVSAETVDRYNDRFQGLNDGTLEIQQFLDEDASDEGRA